MLPCNLYSFVMFLCPSEIEVLKKKNLFWQELEREPRFAAFYKYLQVAMEQLKYFSLAIHKKYLFENCSILVIFFFVSGLLQRNSVNELEGKGPFTVFVPKHSALSQTTVAASTASNIECVGIVFMCSPCSKENAARFVPSQSVLC